MTIPVFRVRLVIDHLLTLEQIWPDGDGPDKPTADDVQELMESLGDPLSVADDWGLDPDSGWEVTEL